MPKVEAKSSRIFATTELCVAAELLGTAHNFDFDGFHVIIKLPEDINGKHPPKATVSCLLSDELAGCHIHHVTLEIIASEKVNVPDEALTNPPNQIEHFSDDEKQAIEKLTDVHGHVSNSAFAYWLEIMRWSSGEAFIGQDQVDRIKSVTSTTILEANTNKRLWSAGISLMSRIRDTWITKEKWETAEKRLQNEEKIPIHIQFMHSAENSTRNQYNEKAVVELAMACETYLRYSVFEFIPSETPTKIREHIEAANIAQYYNQFFKSLVPKKEAKKYKDIIEEIKSLIAKRNAYLHMGNTDKIDNDRCKRYVKSIKELFTIQLENKTVKN